MWQSLYAMCRLPNISLFRFKIRARVKVKFTLSLIKHHDFKMYEGLEVNFHVFLTSALDADGWLASRPDRFNTGEYTPG
jgi:hypothetical protein